jgi:hypothetical protein
MTISWAGSELARQGFVAVGNTQGTTILNATSIQPGQLFPLLTKSGRMPENTIEIKWRPGAFDQTFSSFTTGVAPDANDLSRAGALSVFYSGLPAGGAGFLVKKTAVYEYIPSLSLKIASVPTSRNTSNNTLDDFHVQCGVAGEQSHELCSSRGARIGACGRAVAVGNVEIN